MDNQANTLIIIATYNERDNIKELITQIFTITPLINILVIDDNSPDKTSDIVSNMTHIHPTLHLITRQQKLGLGTAYILGFEYGMQKQYENIMYMDADFSHDPKYIPIFLDKIKSYDMVLGSRYIKHGGIEDWGITRKLISCLGNYYARFILGTNIHDLTGGFKCFRRTTLENINIKSIKSNGYSFQIETTYRAYRQHMSILEIPIIFKDRAIGTSKMSLGIMLEALYIVMKLRFII